MILSRDASNNSQKHFLARENSEERIKTALDRLTVREDEDQKNAANQVLLIKPIAPMGNTNLDILPFTDFGNKAVWEATEGRNAHFALATGGGSNGSGG